MPPKKPNEPSKKTEQKKQAKVIEDKTFGLKNKKGGKQQKFIQQVQKQVVQGNKSAKQIEKDKEQKLLKKDDKQKQLDELNQLFRPVVEQKITKGVDPKSVLCAFFKSGQCTKGDKCKFSHDLGITRKTEKRSMYDDVNTNDEDSMANWDEQKLEEVVDKKHGERNKSLPKTDIICKYFLDAVENSKYGWFWECPNGEACHYRHALPPGFMLKKDKKKEDKGEEISLEDLIERERAALGSNLTKVTLESFLLWKERKRREKIEKETSEKEKRHADYKAGRAFGISGREMFEFNPDLVAGDDDEADDTSMYRREDDEMEGASAEGSVFREISLEALAREAREVDGTGTVSSTEDRQKRLDEAAAIHAAHEAAAAAAAARADDEGAAAACGEDGEEEEGEEQEDEDEDVEGNGMDEAIDENLFAGDDILDVEEELEHLEVQS